MQKTNKRQPKEIDIAAANYLKEKRKESKISQEKVGEALDVTFQQIQKVDKGVNRLSISGFVGYCNAIRITPDRAIKDILARMAA